LSQEQNIRRQLATAAGTYDEALPLVEKALSEAPSVGLWVLRGQLIQLSECGPYTLDDVRLSYEAARELDPTDSAPVEELGHFFDAVMADPQVAREYYAEALSLGAGEDCRRTLAELEEEGSNETHPSPHISPASYCGRR